MFGMYIAGQGEVHVSYGREGLKRRCWHGSRHGQKKRDVALLVQEEDDKEIIADDAN